MTDKEKDLLIKDICARLPYEVIVDYSYNAYDLHKGNYVKHVKHGSKCILTCSLLDAFISPRQNEAGEYIKPYLFPMSSMTDEQEKEWRYTLSSDYNITYDTVDWCNKNHFDYRGLIEKGLAIDATNLNVY